MRQIATQLTRPDPRQTCLPYSPLEDPRHIALTHLASDNASNRRSYQDPSSAAFEPNLGRPPNWMCVIDR